MTKRLRVIGNERLDLEDFLHGGSGFTVAELKLHVQQLLSELSGVIEGFDVALDGAPGTATNVLRIHNGAALDPTLQLVHVEDAPGTVALLALEGAGLHHVGVVFRLVPSDTAARCFWDPGAPGADGATGREFIQEVRTRLSVTWQPVSALDDPSFASAGIDRPDLVIPLCVVPVIAPAGPSVIDTSRLRLEHAVGKVLALDTSNPARTTVRVHNARRFRVGSALAVPLSANAYSVDHIDPHRNELVVTPPLTPADQARAVAVGFVVNRADALPESTWGYRFIAGRGRLADPTDAADRSAPGDVRARLFEGDAARGERLLGRPRDVPDRLPAGERLTGRDEEGLGKLKDLRDALAFVIAEAKFGARPHGESAPRWIDPVPVPLWDIARLYFNELNGTGVVSGGLPTALQVLPGSAPGRWSARISFPETVYYAQGVRHRMPAVVQEEHFGLAPAAGVLYAYWWATPRANDADPGRPLTGPDWPTAPTRIERTTGAEVFHPDPPPPTPRSVLLGAARFDNRGGGALPTATLVPMARVPRRVADLLAPDAAGRLQRDLVFRTWADLGDPGRRISVDDPHGRLNVDVGAGTLVVHSGGTVTLLSDLGGRAAALRGRQAGPGSPTVIQLDPTGLDLTAATALRLWDATIGGQGEARGSLAVAPERRTGLRRHGRVTSLVGSSGDGTLAGTLRLDATDGFDQDGWSDGTILVEAEVLEVRRRLRLMSQAAMINVDRDAAGHPRGPEQGFNFLNAYKVPLAWAYVALQGGTWRLVAQSHYETSPGGPDRVRAEPAWLPPFASPVAPPPALVEVIAPTSSQGAIYGFQLPWARWLRPTAPSTYIVTLAVNPRYEAWRRHATLGPSPRMPYNTLPSFCTSADVAWYGLGRSLTFRSGQTLDAADGPILVYSYPSAFFDGIEGVMVSVWGALGRGSTDADPTDGTATRLGSV